MITVVGAGALGSHVVLFLRNIDQHIKIVDFDRVETKNTQAQFHTFMSIRHNKASALSQAMRGMFGCKMEFVPYRLCDDNVSAVLQPGVSELVLDCTDNGDTRRMIMTFCRVFEVPCLHGCLSADGTFSQVIWSEHFVPDDEGEEVATCEDGEHLPFFAATAAYMAVEAQRYLKTGKKSSVQLTPAGLVRLR